MFKSEEMNNAEETLASITSNPQINVDLKSIKKELKNYVLLKDINLLTSYDCGFLNGIKTNSSREYIKVLLNVIKELYLIRYKEETNKCLIIKKLFDNMSNNLDCLLASGTDLSSDEVNAAILGLVNRNFL